jgi:putative addiction module killer protein
LKVIEYVTENGRCPYREWLTSLDGSIKFRVQARIMRIVDHSNLGECKGLGNQLFEIKFKKLGGGIRVYFGKDNDTGLILLLGGNKASQSSDISKSKKYWQEYNLNKSGEV